MIDRLFDVISNGVTASCGAFALLAVIGISIFWGDKFIIYIVKKVRERHNNLKEKEPK